MATGYVKDRTVAFVIDVSVQYDPLVDGDEADEQEEDTKIIRKALRALNKKVGVRERIILAVSKPEKVFRIWMDAESKHHLHLIAEM